MIKKNCNICDSSKTRVLFEGRDRLHKIDDTPYKVVQCQNCGLVYLNPQPEWNELKKYYPDEYAAYGENSQIFKYGYLTKILKKIKNKLKRTTYDKKKETVADVEIKNYLDFGCGGGIWLENQRKVHPNWNFYGLDISEIACSKTEERGFKVFCGNFLDMNFPENFFDIVNMSHVIEHLSDPKSVLTKLNKSLKSGGELIISTPDFGSFASKIFKKYWYALESPRHLFLFSHKTLSRLLNDTNFTIKKVEYDKGPKVFIRSVYYFFGKKDLRISPALWRLLTPFSRVLAYFGKTSLMTFYVQKNKNLF